jgi:hypothetical protein
MENSLQQLNTAIQARIQKENLFIQRITQEFARISADLQRTASANPQVQLQPFIRRIDEATELLNRRPSFGTNFNLDALVQSVKGRPNTPPNTPPTTPTGSVFSGLGDRFSGLFSQTPRPTTPYPYGPQPSAPPQDDDDGDEAVLGGKRKSRGGWKSKTRRTRRSRRPK